MKRYLQVVVGLSIATFLVSPLLAHPGHGEPGSNHYFATSEHLLPVLVILAFLLMAFGAVLRGHIIGLIAKR